MKKPYDLLVVTNQFPYGKDETFLMAEVKVLSSCFNKVAILPLVETENLPPRELPENCEVIQLKHTPAHSLKLFVALFRNLLVMGPAEVKQIVRHNLRYPFSFAWNKLKEATLWAQLFKKNQQVFNNFDLIYFYWADHWLCGAACVKNQGLLHAPLVSRAHNFDIYTERQDIPVSPWKRFAFLGCEKIFPISAHGRNYLAEKYSLPAHSLSVQRLGIDFPSRTARKKASKPGLALFSCSRISEVKRVHLIVEALKKVSIPCHWYHIGTGELEQEVKAMLPHLPSNIRATFTGHMPNHLICDFYLEKQMDVFINVSSFEGIPVSIMEAMACGAYVIATDVGGTSELVRPEFATLLQKDFKVDELSNEIERLYGYPAEELEMIASKGKIYVHDHFDARKNHNRFATELIKIIDQHKQDE